ncbi:MAG: dephospho-CoA kinase [Lachnospiraceae bacterium]|nr:dephospho-CoA kinase [Lachnospiraceae bacterium]
MAVIGITGGAGSGKSFVAALAAENFDMLHIDTDRLARTQMMPGGASYAGVAEAFPDCLCECKDNTDLPEIDRAALAKKVFGNKELLGKLNGLTHPHVRETVESLIEGSKGLFTHVLIETAILADAGYCPICDAVWLVTAPEEDRKKRLTERGYDETRIESVFGSQPSDEEYRKTSTHEIRNGSDADEESIIAQIKEILKSMGADEILSDDDDEDE